MFDSHCHLHSELIGARAGELIARARAAGVRGFLLAGVDPDGWEVEDALALAHSDMFVACGVHPQLVAERDRAWIESSIEALRDRVARRRPAAIGEIGLDGLGERRGSLDEQERAFRAQLAIAREHELPVVLHILDAHARALEVLADAGLPRAGGVVHSYSGSAELTRDYLALGLHLSFAGTVTNERARKTRRAAAVVPRERLLVETDAPFQTPPAHRPADNEPAFLVAIVAALAQIRGESPAELAAYTEKNARRLFA